MKFSAKLALSTVTLLCVTLSIGGALNISRNFAAALQTALTGYAASHQRTYFSMETELGGMRAQSVSDILNASEKLIGSSVGQPPCMALLSPEGTVLYSNLPGEISYADMLAAVNAGEERALFLRVDSHDWVMMATPLQGVGRPLWLAEAWNVTALFGERDRQVRQHFVLSAAVIAAAAIVAVAGSRRLTGPLRRLEQASRELEAGNLGVRVEFATSDEVQRIGEGFNRMADAIGSQMDELREERQYVQSQYFTSTAEIMDAMKEMFRDVIQQVMEVEMDEELGRERCQRVAEENPSPNYRNGYSPKTVKTQLGEIDIKVPRDRKGNYEPRIISKYDRNAEGMEDKILSLYACGMSQRDIAEQIKSLYDVEISPELVSKISEKIMPEVNAWQNRPLEAVYPFIFMDAIHYKVKEDHRYVTKAAYVVLGITMDGRKDILGVWIGEHESSKFWLNVLNDLKSRGVLDVYLFCTDGLCGMMEAIQAVYPKSRLQRCIVHQIRSSTKYVSYKDIKKVTADLKKIYTAVTLDEAEENLRIFGTTWRKQYPSCVKSWEDNWEVLSTFFEYPPEIRKIIYTTNIIEGLNRQFRQITKNKPSFTNDDSLRRMLYLASQRIVKHWHARCQNWDMVLSQLDIMFADRKVG